MTIDTTVTTTQLVLFGMVATAYARSAYWRWNPNTCRLSKREPTLGAEPFNQKLKLRSASLESEGFLGRRFGSRRHVIGALENDNRRCNAQSFSGRRLRFGEL
jgi:hypothetical protein